MIQIEVGAYFFSHRLIRYSPRFGENSFGSSRVPSPGSVGAWSASGAAGTYLMIDPKARLIAMLFTQSIPDEELPRNPKRLSFRFYNLVYQSLEAKR